MKIKDMSLDDRPREKMASIGASALSNAELLAVLIGSGIKGKNAVDTSRELLQKSVTLTKLSSMSMAVLKSVPGIGAAGASRICAAIELGRRFALEDCASVQKTISDPDSVYKLMQPRMKGMDHEECWCIFLSKANHVITKERLFTGAIDSTLMDSRIIAQKALELKATGVILIHNHPSGNPSPSINDMKYTELLHKALETMGIKLVDHVIICDSSYFSFSSQEVSR